MTGAVVTIDLFTDKIGQTFVIEEAGVPAVALTLTEAKPIPNYANVPRPPFSLLFTSQGIDVLPQRTYALRHAALGLQLFFLVPIGKKADVVTYQAIFN